MENYKITSKNLDINRDGYVSCIEIVKPLNQIFGDHWPLLEIESIYELVDGNIVNLLDRDYDKLRNKIQAIKSFVVCDSFFTQALVFEKICLAVCEKYIDFESQQDLDVADICFAIDELRSCYPFLDELFSGEVCSYVASQSKEEGFITTPEQISFCQEMLDKLNCCLSDIDGIKKSIESRINEVEDLSELSEESVVDVQVIKLLSIANSETSKRGS